MGARLRLAAGLPLKEDAGCVGAATLNGNVGEASALKEEKNCDISGMSSSFEAWVACASSN